MQTTTSKTHGRALKEINTQETAIKQSQIRVADRLRVMPQNQGNAQKP